MTIRLIIIADTAKVTPFPVRRSLTINIDTVQATSFIRPSAPGGVPAVRTNLTRFTRVAPQLVLVLLALAPRAHGGPVFAVKPTLADTVHNRSRPR